MLPFLGKLTLADVSMGYNDYEASGSGSEGGEDRQGKGGGGDQRKCGGKRQRRDEEDGLGRVREGHRVTPAVTRQGARDAAERDARRKRVRDAIYKDSDDTDNQKQIQRNMARDFKGTPDTYYREPAAGGSRSVARELEDSHSLVHQLWFAYDAFMCTLAEHARSARPGEWSSFDKYHVPVGIIDSPENNPLYLQALGKLVTSIASNLRSWHTHASGALNMPTALLFMLSITDTIMCSWDQGKSIANGPLKVNMPGALEAMRHRSAQLEQGLLRMIVADVSQSDNTEIRDVEYDLQGVLSDIADAMWNQVLAARGDKNLKPAGEQGGGRVALDGFYEAIANLVGELEFLRDNLAWMLARQGSTGGRGSS